MSARNENSWLRSLITGVFVSSLATFTTGCDTMHDYTVTGHLWDVGGVNRCMPASSPNLKLYRRSDNQDVLVTYDELREKNDKTRSRAFFFQTNVDRLVQG